MSYQTGSSYRMDTCSHGGIYSVDPTLVQVDFSSSINPLGISKRALQSIKKNTAALASVYPDPECRELRKSLAGYLRVNAEQISVGNGAMELIYWFARAFAKKRAVIPSPTFCEYELASRRSGADVSLVPSSQMEIDADEITERAKVANADAIFLCNPNNPTGILSTGSIKKIIEQADSIKILLDECFVELVDDPVRNSLVSKIGEYDNVVILRSLTKSFGLAGLRLGYCICNARLARQMSEFKIPWNVNGLAQSAGVAALKDMGHLARARTLIKKERQFLYTQIQKMHSFVPLKSDANYFLIRLKKKNSTEFRNKLLKKKGVLVRDCSTFTGMGTDYVRVAVKARRENLLLLKALESADKW